MLVIYRLTSLIITLQMFAVYNVNDLSFSSGATHPFKMTLTHYTATSFKEIHHLFK